MLKSTHHDVWISSRARQRGAYARSVTAAEPPLTMLSRFWLQSHDLFHEAAAAPLAPGSIAASDAQRVSGSVSPIFVATGKLFAAYDAARAVSTLWKREESHIVADYALLRAVVECAAQAWWVITPADSDERIRRAARIARDDLGQALIREKHAVTDAGAHDLSREARARNIPQIERLLAAVADAMLAAGVQLEPTHERKRKLDLHEILHEAEGLIDGVRPLEVTLNWAMLSSLSHGSLTSIQLSVFIDEGLDGTRTMTADPNQIATLALSVTPVLRAAHDNWQKYSARVMP